MAKVTVRQIEDAILAALEPLKTASGEAPLFPPILRTLKSYQGELQKQEEIAHLIDEIRGMTPAAFVIYGGSQFDSFDVKMKETIFFGLFIVDESLRGAEYARRGSSTNVGGYEVIERVDELLSGNALGLNILPLEIQSAEGLYADDRIVIYMMVYKTEQNYLKP